MGDRREPPRGASTAAEARLAAELGASIGRTRMAWDAACLRGDAALRNGDRDEAARALDEQRALLRDLHTQVDEALGRATVEREAESVVDAAAAERAPVGERAAPGRRTPAGVVAGAVLAGALGLLAILPVAPPVPEVAGLAADRPTVDADAVPEDRPMDTPPAAAAPSAVEVAGSAAALPPIGVTFERASDVLGELAGGRVDPDVPADPDGAALPPAPDGAPAAGGAPEPDGDAAAGRGADDPVDDPADADAAVDPDPDPQPSTDDLGGSPDRDPGPGPEADVDVSASIDPRLDLDGRIDGSGGGLDPLLDRFGRR